MRNTACFTILLTLLFAALCIAQSKPDQLPSLSDLKTNGAFGFPQKDARVLHDDKNLSFSVTSDADYLFAQAILWNDGDASNLTLTNGKTLGDYSSIMFLSGSDKKRTPDVDRNYSINPLPHLRGLYYSVVKDAAKLGFGRDKFVSSPLQNDSHGRGRIDYVSTAQGKIVRVDSYLIPLMEISKRQGDTIKFCYFGYSAKPALIVNSAGFSPNESYYDYQIPIDTYHRVHIDMNASINVSDWPK